MSEPGHWECDFCYNGLAVWDAGFTRRDKLVIWELKLCDSCRLLIRNVIGPVLHRMSHTDFVTAIMQMMAQRGLTYDDLMQPLREMKAIESKEITVDTEGTVVRTDP